jgi:hypothetical protein
MALQNKSHAVMAQRIEPPKSLDDFPTPKWASRAFVEHVMLSKEGVDKMTCLEPSCGRGHMATAFEEYFKEVVASDIFDYGFGQVNDFLSSNYEANSVDWVITNPPFRLAEEFILRSLEIARVGVAMLTRTVFIESVGRYERLFKNTPPVRVGQFTERVPMVKGRVDKKASTATGYAWLMWHKGINKPTELFWIPPCRKSLERDGDYVQFPSSKKNIAAEVVVMRKPHKNKQQDLFGE